VWDLPSLTPLDVRYKSEILRFSENYPAPPTVVRTQKKLLLKFRGTEKLGRWAPYTDVSKGMNRRLTLSFNTK